MAFFQNIWQSKFYSFQSLMDFTELSSCVMGFRLSITAYLSLVKIKLQSCTDSSKLQFFWQMHSNISKSRLFSHDKLQGQRLFFFFFRFPWMLLFTEKSSFLGSVSESHFGNEYELNLQIDVNWLTSNYVDMN